MKSAHKKIAREKKSTQRFSLSREDKKFYGFFLLGMAIITLLLWFAGAKNPFLVPTLLCVALVWRNNRKQSFKSSS